MRTAKMAARVVAVLLLVITPHTPAHAQYGSKQDPTVVLPYQTTLKSPDGKTSVSISEAYQDWGQDRTQVTVVDEATGDIRYRGVLKYGVREFAVSNDQAFMADENSIEPVIRNPRGSIFAPDPDEFFKKDNGIIRVLSLKDMHRQMTIKIKDAPTDIVFIGNRLFVGVYKEYRFASPVIQAFDFPGCKPVVFHHGLDPARLLMEGHLSREFNNENPVILPRLIPNGYFWRGSDFFPDTHRVKLIRGTNGLLLLISGGLPDDYYTDEYKEVSVPFREAPEESQLSKLMWREFEQLSEKKKPEEIDKNPLYVSTQSVLEMSADKPTVVKFGAAGGRPPYQFFEKKKQDGVAVEPDGTITLQPAPFLRTAALRWLSDEPVLSSDRGMCRQNYDADEQSPDAVIQASMSSFEHLVMDILGRRPTGMPYFVVIGLVVRDADNREIPFYAHLVLDVPKQFMVQVESKRDRKAPGTKGPDNAVLARVADDLIKQYLNHTMQPAPKP